MRTRETAKGACVRLFELKIFILTSRSSSHSFSWAFVDFTTTDHATTALVNPKNHRLDGRSLVVEYASAEAVRRGGGGPRPKPDEAPGQRTRGSFRGGRGRPGDGGRDRGDRVVDRAWKGSKVETTVTSIDDSAEASQGREPRRPAGDGVGYKGVKGRSKPGAALALAKRESTAIVASQGKKITF